MPKTKISEFSTTPGNNTDIDGINIAEGCAPSGINDAIRELMSQLKDFQTGAAGDPFNGAVNGTVGATTPSTGAFTTLSASGVITSTLATGTAPFSVTSTTPVTNLSIGGNAATATTATNVSGGSASVTTLTTSGAVTHNAGTANGVAYLNGSKVLTTGSALTFDGTNLGIGSTAPTYRLTVVGAQNSTVAAFNDSSAGEAARNLMFTSSSNGLYWTINSQGSLGLGQLAFAVNSSEGMRLTSTGLGIGTSSPTNTLSVSGSANITGNTTLGDASTDTVTVNGYMGVGGAAQTRAGLWLTSSALSGGAQEGIVSLPVGTSSATATLRAIVGKASTAAAAFTVTNLSHLYADDATKGAGSTITNQHGLYIADQTQGTNNYGITSLVSSGANKWNIYASGTAANYFAGNLLVGTTSGSYKVDVSGDVNVTGSYRVNGVATTGLTGGQTGSAPLYGARAWVNFNGTGTVAIRASGNVSSITDNGVCDYTVNFTTAMPDANYSVNGGGSVWISNHFNQTVGTKLASASSFVTKTVSSVRVSGPSNSTDDPFDVNVVIFR